MNYLSKFDPSGKRITSYPLDNSIDDKKREELIADGYIEISEEDWNYYVGNKGNGANGTGYIRSKDGKPTSAPAYVPTKEERKQTIISQYESDKAELQTQLVDALLTDDTTTQAEIKDDLITLNEQFDKNIAELEG